MAFPKPYPEWRLPPSTAEICIKKTKQYICLFTLQRGDKKKNEKRNWNFIQEQLR